MIGTDIIEIERIKDAIQSEHFLKRIYTHKEIQYITSKADPAQTAAGIFCCKEAVSKALGTGIAKGVNFSDIEILHDDSGKPIATLYGKAKEIFTEKNYKEIGITVSHCKSYAVAFCILL